MTSKIILGGRAFVPVTESTVDHDQWWEAQRRRAGLNEMDLRPGESADAFAARLVDELLASHRASLLLAGLIVPEGMSGLDWSIEMASETATFLRGLHTDEDKATVRALICELFIKLFAEGLSSLSGPTDRPAPSQPDATEMNGAASGIPIPASLPGDAGPISSASSAATTPSGRGE